MNPNEILEACWADVNIDVSSSFISEAEWRGKIEFICRCHTNKAPIRFLIACLLAKIDRPEIDIRKPYTEISGNDTYSGRAYDESFVESFVSKYRLPCNSTTAFLTPAFRNIDRLLTTSLVMVGKPREVYVYLLELLDIVYKKQLKEQLLLKEILRFLLIIRTENEDRMKQLLSDLKQTDDILPLSSEQIVTLLYQHLNCRNSSRLPVLIVTAVYSTIGHIIGERTRNLYPHNAADKQTGSIGDIEVTISNDDKIVSCYEMKDKKVTINDINLALKKASNLNPKIDNYIFITTDIIETEVTDYATSIYEQTGIEIVILDCLGFIRHFLHFFHRHRIYFLNKYQELVMEEPDSAIGQPLKEAFLILRKQAETN